ncbi:MAG: anthranilate phosphoribosyltransferase [Desulfovibrionaceae bacterium]|nr:anthranilate phosphoribosyltransferase [Desulfovibrionaceae bacterium]
MFLLIDNYDSFTYNLLQAFYSLGFEPHVVYNDDPSLVDLAARPDLEAVCISPGPGRPEQAGACLQFLERLPQHIPVLGVCLGMQILGLFAGAKIERCPEILHGKQSEISHVGTGLFADLPPKLLVGRYHSLMVSEVANPKYPFMVTARGPAQEIMGLSYKDRPWVGVQFHPESILTPQGMQLLGNFPKELTRVEDPRSKFVQILDAVANGEDLSRAKAQFCFGELLDGSLTPAQAGSFLMALRMKGETSVELACAARALLERSIKVPEITTPHIDVVGTGGDGKHSFNCSTATALILAGMGYMVTKHGNRAVSSTCGSADAVEGLGLPLESEPQEVLTELSKRNFAFIFARHFHPVFKHLAPIRAELGVRTLFNLLGPLLNPARPTHILLGVAKPSLVPLVTDVLLELQQPVAAVVCGAGEYDEITPLGIATVSLIRGGRTTKLALNPADFGIAPCTPKQLAVHSKREAVAVLQDLLQGQGPAPMLDMLVLNVGLALYLLEAERELGACMAQARLAVRQGVAQKVLYA